MHQLSRPVRTLLVANRGEIAVRVMRSAHARGIGTVAVYSDADREAPHVRAADQAMRIGPAPASSSYLDIDALLDAARRTGADAVHPGYGFLSERAEFARAVVEAGLTFVGPPAEVIELMGRKDRARQIAVAAGVPVIPQVEVPDLSPEPGAEHRPDLEELLPVLVKAAAGGGGKGMRIVRDLGGLRPALDAARREARSAFGDDTLLVERYVERGRHVEVQVLADLHGNVVHLFERDCSAQRRHQKVLEEAPAPTITEAVRGRLLDAAVALAKQVGYVNAGTVEFLVAADEVYFLEMNTRLQVEHPVTEAVVSVAGRPLDLVDLQLLVADGVPLPFAQGDVRCAGHAIEARVYAEDAFHGFLPQAGRAELVRWSPRARVDAAVESGAEVTTAYDPMLGKVIASGPDREAARRALVTALDDTAILGLTTNLGFVRALAASPAFRDNQVDTAWLDRSPDAIRPPAPDRPALIAAWALAHPHAPGDLPGPFDLADGWRMGAPPAPIRVGLVVDGAPRTYAVTAGDVDAVPVHPVAGGPGVIRLEIDGVVHEATVLVGRHEVQVAYQGHRFRFDRPDPFGAGRPALPDDGVVTAPMPGTVLAVSVGPGDVVAAGQVLGVVEAMKMELALSAPFAGTVVSVGAGVGDQVALGAELFVVEEEEP